MITYLWPTTCIFSGLRPYSFFKCKRNRAAYAPTRRTLAVACKYGIVFPWAIDQTKAVIWAFSFWIIMHPIWWSKRSANGGLFLVTKKFHAIFMWFKHWGFWIHQNCQCLKKGLNLLTPIQTNHIVVPVDQNFLNSLLQTGIQSRRLLYVTFTITLAEQVTITVTVTVTQPITLYRGVQRAGAHRQAPYHGRKKLWNTLKVGHSRL